jgi:hypothetical protein
MSITMANTPITVIVTIEKLGAFHDLINMTYLFVFDIEECSSFPNFQPKKISPNEGNHIRIRLYM